MILFPLTEQATPSPIRRCELSEIDAIQLQRIATWSYDRDKREYLTRKAPHIVGRVASNGFVFSAAPDIPAVTFVDLVLYSNGIDISKFSSRSPAPTSITRDNVDDFLSLLSHMMAVTASELLKIGVAKSYELRTEVTQAIRGRIKWSDTLKRPPQEGPICEFHQLHLDTKLNRLILAGLEAAAVVRLDRLCNRTLFAWRSLCSRSSPQPWEFDNAIGSLNRLTESYRTGLILARALVCGSGVDDLFSNGPTPFPTMEFNLAILFERMLARLLREALDGTDLIIETQKSDREALTYIDGCVYKSVRPDLRILRKNTPVAVIDAKFKPRYLRPGMKISEDDLYQSFFYAARASAVASDNLIRNCLFVPQINEDPISTKRDRLIRSERSGQSIYVLEIIPVNILSIFHHIQEGGSARGALSTSLELEQLCSDLLITKDLKTQSLAS